jgi:hypothetical protein
MKKAQIRVGMMVRVQMTPKRELVGLVLRAENPTLRDAVLVENDRYPGGVWVRASACKPAKRQHITTPTPEGQSDE